MRNQIKQHPHSEHVDVYEEIRRQFEESKEPKYKDWTFNDDTHKITLVFDSEGWSA